MFPPKVGSNSSQLQRHSKQTAYRLGPGRPWLRLIRDPGVKRCLQLRVEPQADVWANPRPRSAPASFFGTGYCSAPEIMVPINHRTGARRLPCPGSDHRTPWLRRRRMAAAQLNRTLGEWLGAAKPRRDVGRVRAGTVRAPRRPAGADSVRSSGSLRDPFAALGRLG